MQVLVRILIGIIDTHAIALFPLAEIGSSICMCKVNQSMGPNLGALGRSPDYGGPK
jgi:hypothetical protein